ncbi:hypothetical protein GCM10018790_39170 [Kitasatospora xanthocidica]|uniref:hypothetical protein n=1 Tax=Kitasatospora xanthocidica TaxID=83382 RepID=UPI00199EE0DB|nr:hypothetical protein [Kitasatospora xanthocidica]GHF57558.1 hypothetical protein GCM10018790_39170 [Kitasatospora xanthocidica]
MTDNHTTTLPDVDDPHARQLLVLPDRDAADEVAEELGATQPDLGELEIVRDALAGEDDAEDAQWLVVIDAPDTGWTPTLLHALDTLATDHEGWREEA